MSVQLNQPNNQIEQHLKLFPPDFADFFRSATLKDLTYQYDEWTNRMDTICEMRGVVEMYDKERPELDKILCDDECYNKNMKEIDALWAIIMVHRAPICESARMTNDTCDLPCSRYNWCNCNERVAENTFNLNGKWTYVEK